MAESSTRCRRPSVAAIVALTGVAIAGAGLAGCGGGGDSSPTSAGGVSAVTGGTGGTTTIHGTTADLATWVAGQVTAGNTRAFVQHVDGTDEAWSVVAHAPSAILPHGDTRLLLADGTIVELPAELSSVSWKRVVSFGDAIAIVSSIDHVPALWRLDVDTGSWLRGPDLGLVETIASDTEVAVLGDSLLLTTVSATTDSNNFYVPDEQHGVLVSPALELTEMASPPDGVFVQFTSIVGTHALILGRDTAAGFEYPLDRPWEFDAATNEWTPVPLPDWLACAPNCRWIEPHEGGDPWLEKVTHSGVVILLPDRSLGLYDPISSEWRRLESPPFTPATPATAELDGGLLVAANQPANFDGQPFEPVGVLDLATGRWATDDALVSDGWQWEARTDGSVALLKAYDGSDEGPSDPPDYYFDGATRSWRPATEADTALWVRLGGELEITDLATLLR